MSHEVIFALQVDLHNGTSGFGAFLTEKHASGRLPCDLPLRCGKGCLRWFFQYMIKSRLCHLFKLSDQQQWRLSLWVCITEQTAPCNNQRSTMNMTPNENRTQNEWFLCVLDPIPHATCRPQGPSNLPIRFPWAPFRSFHPTSSGMSRFQSDKTHHDSRCTQILASKVSSKPSTFLPSLDC